MANYDSSNTGGQIDGSIASSSLYFSGAAASAHVSASGTITGSDLYINGTIYGNTSTFTGDIDSNDISASGNISSSTLWVTNNISASAIYADEGYFSASSIYLGGEIFQKSHLSNMKKGRKISAITINTFTNGDTTPDVSGGSIFKTKTGIGSTTITDFDGGDIGDEITVICSNALTRINDGSGIETPSSAQLRCNTNAVYKFVYDGTNWYTISVSDNS